MIRNIIVSALLLTSVSAFAYNTGDMYYDYHAGIGYTGYSFACRTGETMGQSLFNDSTYFHNISLNKVNAFNVGIGFEYFITSYISVTTGVTYEEMRISIIYPKNTSPYDLEYNMVLGYFNIPAEVKLHYGYLMAGAGIFYGRNAVSADKITYGTEVIDRIVDSKDNFGYNLDLGAAIDFKLGEDKYILSMYGRYNSGLKYVYENESDILSKISLKTATLNIMISFKI